MGLKQANAIVEDKLRHKIWNNRVTRTIEALTTTPRQEQERKGLIHPLTNVVIDELHLLLRVTDVLSKNLIRAALSHDAQYGAQTSTEVLERPMIKNLLEIVGWHLMFTWRVMGISNSHLWLVGTKRNYQNSLKSFQTVSHRNSVTQ